MSDENTENEAIQTYFKQRWLRIEQFFTPIRSGDEWQRPILALLQTLREQGYHKKLHAGQSMYFLILSRSKVHNLRGGKARIVFEFDQKGGMEVSYYHEDEKISFQHDEIEVVSQLETFLNKLVKEPIM